MAVPTSRTYTIPSGEDAYCGMPRPTAPAPAALALTLAGTVVAGSPASGSITNSGGTAAPWSLAGSGLTISPSSGTLAAGATVSFTATPAVAGSYSVTLTSAGSTITGSPASLTATSSGGSGVSGSTWTPDRTSGTVGNAQFEALPVMQPLLVAGSALTPAIETPHLAISTGGDDSQSIYHGWSGAARTPDEEALIIRGGGHNNSPALENAVYRWDASTLLASRVRNRSLSSALRTLRLDGSAIDAGVDWLNFQNVPQADGMPGAVHTYYGDAYLPPSLLPSGNVKGGVFLQGNAKAVVNLDDGSIIPTDTFWSQSSDWGNCISWVRGSKVWMYSLSPAYWRSFDLLATTSTAWSTTSRGAISSGSQQFWFNTRAFNSGDAIICLIPSRGEIVSLGPTYFNRLRIEQAIAANVSNNVWDPYLDAITLTSSDGSHNDITASSIKDTLNGGTGVFCDPACAYDAAEDCIWMWANNVGGLLYKITGIAAGNTWTVSKIAGTGGLYAGLTSAGSGPRGVFGRSLLFTRGAAKFFLRLTSPANPAEIIRLS